MTIILNRGDIVAAFFMCEKFSNLLLQLSVPTLTFYIRIVSPNPTLCLQK